MKGTHKFQLVTKNLIFDITLRRNITVIRGDGATYKSLFCKAIAAAHLAGTGAHLHSYPDEVFYVTDQEFYADRLAHYTGKNCILVFDETSPCIKTPEFRDAVQSTGCYFILITRGNCGCLSDSTKEVCEFIYSDSLDLSKRVVTLNSLYPRDHYGPYSDQQTIITDNFASGYTNLFTDSTSKEAPSYDK